MMGQGQQFITAWSKDELRKIAEADDLIFLPKPYMAEKLLRALAETLAAR